MQNTRFFADIATHAKSETGGENHKVVVMSRMYFPPEGTLFATVTF